jgi:acyl carrier protein
MTNSEKYSQVYITCFTLNVDDLKEELEYNSISTWDSIGHMSMIAEMEDVFDIMIDIEDILDWSTFGKGKEILKEKYEIDF